MGLAGLVGLGLSCSIRWAAALRVSPSWGNGAVMNVGTNAVVPVSGSRSATIRQPASSTASNSTP